MVGPGVFWSDASRGDRSQSIMALSREQIISLDMAFLCSFSCLPFLAASLFPLCKCTTSTEAGARSRSHDFLQGTVEKSQESKQHVVAVERTAGRSKPVVHVHSASGNVHSGHDSAYCPDIPVLRTTRDVPTAQGVCDCMEWRKLFAGSDAEAGDSQGEEENRNEAYWGWAQSVCADENRGNRIPVAVYNFSLVKLYYVIRILFHFYRVFLLVLLGLFFFFFLLVFCCANQIDVV